ncbi:MAG: DMT family transporter [Clostridia bacterium]|nr:DMT family transporter [Clostridia bacterium]
MQFKNIGAKGSYVAAMLIFGTIGVFTHYLTLPSSVIALARGGIGALFLLVLTLFRKQKINWAAVRGDLITLLLSSAFLGFNWILLFEAYRYTTVATATLCYYMAPIFMILLAPLLWKERLTPLKGLCVLAALAGMVFVSGVADSGFGGVGQMKGVLLGLAAAVLYTCVVVCNKSMKVLSGSDRTILQLGISAVIMLIYSLFTENMTALTFDTRSVILLLVLGIVHTGIAYSLYFSSIRSLEAQTIAIGSYLDPILAVILSALFLREPFGLSGIVGAVLILGAALVSELGGMKKK